MRGPPRPSNENANFCRPKCFCSKAFCKSTEFYTTLCPTVPFAVLVLFHYCFTLMSVHYVVLFSFVSCLFAAAPAHGTKRKRPKPSVQMALSAQAVPNLKLMSHRVSSTFETMGLKGANETRTHSGFPTLLMSNLGDLRLLALFWSMPQPKVNQPFINLCY